ncbi:MAG: hypothetical protein ACXVGN_05995 [Mycobacteriaceae bacterium]
MWPTEAPIQALTQVNVTGTVPVNDTGEVSVAFRNVYMGQASIDEAHNFQFKIIVPKAGQHGEAACGANPVTVQIVEYQGPNSVAGSPLPGTEAGSANVAADCAISVNPGLVGNQQLPTTFEVTPQGFNARATLVLKLDGTAQDFTTNTGGGLDFTAAPSCGSHQLVLTQTFEDQVGSASAEITVDCPQITATPATIPQPSEPATVLVSGSQFHPGQPVTISLDGKAVNGGVTNSDGVFSLPIRAAGLGCAAHQVTAAEQPGPRGPAFLFTASTSLTVTGCRTTPPPRLTLTLDPAVLAPGMLTHVTGTGFAPKQQVTLTWQLPGGGTSLPGTVTVVAGSTGGSKGTIDTYFMVLPHDLLGVRLLVATQGAARVAAPAVVDGGPMEPSTGDQFVYRQ